MITGKTKMTRVLPLLMLSMALALICTLISYPGIFYSDSYVRVHTGYAVLNQMVKTVIGEGAVLETDNAFTVIPSFFIALSYGLTGHVALYTFCQAFAFFLAVFLLIRELNPPRPWVLYVLFGISPVIYGASVYYEANIGSVTGLIVLVLLLRRVQVPETRLEKAAWFLLTVFAAFVMVGYRTNALTVIPVLIVYLWRKQKDWLRRLIPVLAMAVGIALTWIVPWIFAVQGDSNASTGFVWEIITTIQRMDQKTQAEYLDYLDDIFGEGATEEVIRTSGESTVDGFMWGSAVNTEKMSEPGASGRILQKYIRLMAARPGEWFGTKWDFVARAMGISQPLDLSEYDYNRWEMMHEYEFNDSPQREVFHQSFLTEMELLGFYTRRPWVAFLISLLMVIVEYRRKSARRELYALLLWLAAFSYAAYLIVIVVFQVRMFYPALLLMMILDAAITAEWIRTGFIRIRSAVKAGRAKKP